MVVARADSLRTLAFGGISGTYAAVGAALTKNWCIFRITNNTNGDLFVSFDGTTNNLFVPAMSFVLYDLSTNAPPLSVTDNLLLAINTQFYVKQSTAPSSGAVYIEGIYARTSQ
jgi:hypothetical protein